MGQKTHPRGLRLGIIETWDSKWYSEKEYADWLHEDLKIQNYIKEQLFRAGIAKVEIERYPDKCIVHIHTARPGIIIGRRGVEVEKLTTNLERLIGRNVRVVIEEIKRPELNAQLVAEGIALQLERRAAYKVAMKKAVAAAMRMGALGIRILCGGRLSGIEMARREKEWEGRVPLHTLRANIDYGFSEADTTHGKIGVKVWVFKGEIIGKPEIKEERGLIEFPTSGDRPGADSRRTQRPEGRAARRPRRERGPRYMGSTGRRGGGTTPARRDRDGRRHFNQRDRRRRDSNQNQMPKKSDEES